MIVKVMGLVDVLAALIILFAVDFGFFAPVKWLLVLILLIKGVPSLLS